MASKIVQQPRSPAPSASEKQNSRTAQGDAARAIQEVPEDKTLLALYYVFGGHTKKGDSVSELHKFELAYEDSKKHFETPRKNDLQFAQTVQASLTDRLKDDATQLVKPVLAQLQSGELTWREAQKKMLSVLEPLLAYRNELSAKVLDNMHDKSGENRPFYLLTLPRALNTLVKAGKGKLIDIEAKVHKRFNRYLAKMDGRSAVQKELYEKYKRELGKHAWDMKIYSNLDTPSALQVAMTRDVQNIVQDSKMKRRYLNNNADMLSCEGSQMAAGDDLAKKAARPGNQVCLAMRSPVKVGAEVVRPIILSVPAPGLDSNEQPEWDEYVKNGALDVANYTKAMSSIANHIMTCARDNPGHRVVLSGFGLASFINGLPEAERKRARTVGAGVMQQLIKDLNAANIACAYIAGNRDDAPWNQIDSRLKPEFLGRFPGKDDAKSWLQDTDIVVNAWDPHSLVGNGCEHDNSLDGYIGRMCLAHETHALGCNVFQQLAKKLPQPASGKAGRANAQRADAKAKPIDAVAGSAALPANASLGVTLGAFLDAMAGQLAPTDPKGVTTVTAVLGNPTTASSTGATTTTKTTTTTTTTTAKLSTTLVPISTTTSTTTALPSPSDLV